MKDMKQKISVKDVAEAAGVSIATVSRSLNDSGYVSDEVRRRIGEAVKTTGYVPNHSARQLRTGRSRTIGLMVSNMANPLLSELFAALEFHLYAAGYSLLVASTYDIPAREAELLAMFETRRVEAIIVAPSRENFGEEDNPYANCKLPLLVFDRDVDFPADFVLQDHRASVRQATRYLASLGHRRIALFGPSLAIRGGRERLEGYKEGLKAAGLPFDDDLICMLRSVTDQPVAQMEAMMVLEQPLTAMICLGTTILPAAMNTARQAGRRIPDDLSVIGIGTEAGFALMYPPMTAVRFNLDQVARAATDLILRRLAEPEADRLTRTINLDLVLGETCRPPAAEDLLATVAKT